MSIVDDARRRHIRHAIRHARLARAQRSRRRTEVRRASNGRAAGLRIGDDGPVSAACTGLSRPASRAAAPSLARRSLYHRRRAVKWRATDTDYWCGCGCCIAASGASSGERQGVERRRALSSGYEYTIFVATLSSESVVDPFLFGNDR
ncbi:TPA: hypothetical protein ACV4T7_005945 [Burkholderia ambifaria]